MNNKRIIKIEFTGRSKEEVTRSVRRLADMIESLYDQTTVKELDMRVYQIMGYCACCVDNEIIKKNEADEIIKMVCTIASIEGLKDGMKKC